MSTAAVGIFPLTLLLALIVISTLLQISNAFHAIKVPSTESGQGESHLFYRVHRNTVRQIPDVETVKTLGFSLEHIEEVSHKVFKEFKHHGPPIEQVHQKDASPDELMRVELLKNKILQGRLIQNITYVGEYINPSIVPFCGRLFMAVGLAWGFHDGQEANEHVEFKWVNHTLRPFYSNERYYSVGTKLEALDVPIIGQDPRMISTMRDNSTLIGINDRDLENAFKHDKLFITFTYRYSKPVSMGMAEIVCNHDTQTINVTRYDVTFKFYQEGYSDQKNWSPFLYQGQMLWIQRINPLIIVEPMRPEKEEKYAKFVSTTERITNLPWKHGELRGGTNAVFLGDKYLAFFHSSIHIPGDPFSTYIFGAYTFSSQPPFRLLAISPLPLMDDSLYTGPWDPLKNRHIDYVAFPSTCFLHGDEVVMSFGWQDHMGMTATFKLKHLLQTLEPVGVGGQGGNDTSWDSLSAEDLPANRHKIMKRRRGRKLQVSERT